jgi:hypothetical protein
LGLERAGAISPAIRAVAIPLGEAAAGGRPKNPDLQRLETYIVISMPNRISIACGVSHFMMNLLELVPFDVPTEGAAVESATS